MKFHLIQIYRAIAALLVVAFHINFNTTEYFGAEFFGNFFNFGYMGVDYFFVLSGFIITYIHYNDVVNRTNFVPYIKKRLIRILPIYWVIATVSLLSYFVFTHGYIKSMDKQLSLHSTDDILYILRSYFLIPGKLSFFVKVAWTLSFELLFYLVFSICIKSGIKTAYVIFYSWIVFILLNNYVFHFPGVIDFITNLYILQFLIGCLVAYLILKKFTLPVNTLVILIFVSLGALIYANYYYGLSDKNLVSFLLLAVNASLIIMFCTKFIRYNERNILVRAGILIGDASYSVYLSHIFFMSFLARLLTKPVLGLHLSQWKLNTFFLAFFLLIVLCGVILHLTVEKPVLNFLHGVFLKKKAKVPITVGLHS